ncbi:MAG: hypothetical protein ISR80_04760 [Nitrosopumilus sp.]|nr:hypothetical protein [Nitrosopumilus sp.]
MYKTLSIGLFAMLFVGFSIVPAFADDINQRFYELESDFEQKRQSISQYYDEQYRELEQEYGVIKLEVVQKIEQNDFSDSEIDAMYNELFSFYNESRAEIDSAMLLEFEELERMFQEEIERVDAEYSDYEKDTRYDETINDYDSTYTDYNADGTAVTNHDEYYDNYEQNEREYFESDPEWVEIQPLAQRIMDIIPMEKIQRLWESPQHDALVELIVAETNLTIEEAKKVIAFFERVERQDDYQKEEYYEKEYREYDYVEPTYAYVEPQVYYDDSEVLRLEQKITELQAENDTLRNEISELKVKLEQVNAVVMEQIKIIYEWVLGQ